LSAGASPQTPLGIGELTAFPQTLAVFRKRGTDKREKGEERRGGETRKGEGEREIVLCRRKKKKVSAYAAIAVYHCTNQRWQTAAILRKR